MTEEGNTKSEAIELKARSKEVINASGIKLLRTVADIQDTLYTTISSAEIDEEFAGDLEAFGVISDAIVSFCDSDPVLTTVTPRRLREKDRVKILPGQHGGITLKFDLEDGNSLRMNVYGGLRGIVGEDMRDMDKTLTRLHSSRTDSVLNQPTQINWHITKPDETVLCDVWINYELSGSISLSNANFEGNRIELNGRITGETYGFEDIRKNLNESIGNLVTLIPSA